MQDQLDFVILLKVISLTTIRNITSFSSIPLPLTLNSMFLCVMVPAKMIKISILSWWLGGGWFFLQKNEVHFLCNKKSHEEMLMPGLYALHTSYFLFFFHLVQFLWAPKLVL